MAKRPAIGIDLGTSYSCVAVFRNGKVEVIPNDEGSKVTPSYVAFKDAKRLIGDSAKRHSNINPCNTAFGAKKLIGKHFDDQSVQRDMKHWPFDIVPTKDKRPVIQMDYEGESKTFYPEEISSMILSKMKDVAEMHLGQTVTNAVVTVPAYFSDAQRRATKDACTIAGLNVYRIISEPTAAAIAYGMENRGQREFNILVFDLGGGFCSVSILTLEDGVFETKATAGETNLGGEDFDNRLVSYFAKEFEKEHQKDLTTSKAALRRLRTACEEAKKSLSSRTQTNIEIEYLLEGINFCSSITRSKFEELNADLFKRTVELVEKVLPDAKLDKAEIHGIVLVGGSTRIPKVQELLQAFFDGKHLIRSIHPDEAVACGAAIQAAILNGDKSKEIQGLLLLDTIPYSLGIGTSSEEMCFVIKKNTTIPTRQVQEFSTQFDNQSAVLLKVYEGENEKTKANNLLGQFELHGISRTPEGKVNIEVCFDVDANGIFSVSAVDKSTEKANRITVNDKGRLPQVEIERMVRDAKKYKDEEDKQKSRISSRTALENYAWNAKSTVADNNLEDQISVDDKNKILDMTNDTLAWLHNTEFAEKEEYEQKHKELQRVCAPILVKLNKNTDDDGMPDSKRSFCCCN